MTGARQAVRGAALVASLAAALAVAAPAWGGAGAATAKPIQAQQKAQQKANGVAARPAATVSTGAGIVQAVGARALVVRELDGSIVRVLIDPKTRVFVNGVRSSLANVKPGFVVQFAGPGRVARVLRAQGPKPKPKPKAGAAAVVSVSPDAIVVSRAAGSSATIPVDARTRVFVDGAPATLADVRTGDLVVSGGPAKRPVPVLRLRRPG